VKRRVGNIRLWQEDGEIGMIKGGSGGRECIGIATHTTPVDASSVFFIFVVLNASERANLSSFLA